jgi:hypothetical protein
MDAVINDEAAEHGIFEQMIREKMPDALRTEEAVQGVWMK